MRLRLSLLMLLQYAPAGAVLPLYSLRLVQLGFDPDTVAGCCATQALAVAVGTPLAGQVADRWVSAERCLGACAFLAAADLWALAGLESPGPIFLATLVFWLLCGPSILLGATIAFTHLAHPERDYGPVRLWGTVGWMVAGWLVGYWLSGPAWLGPALPARRPDGAPDLGDAFRVGAVLSLLLGLYTLTLPHTPPARSAAQRWAPAAAFRLLRGRAFFVYCTCLLGVCLTMSFTSQATPLLLRDLGVSEARLSAVLTLAQASEVVCIALLPTLLLRAGTRGSMLLGLGAWATALAVLTLGRPVELVIASLGLNGLFIAGFLVAGQVFVNHRAAGGLRASAQALSTAVNGAGMLAGHLLVGWLRAQGGDGLARTFGVGAVVAAGVLVLFLLGFSDDAAGGK